MGRRLASNSSLKMSVRAALAGAARSVPSLSHGVGNPIERRGIVGGGATMHATAAETGENDNDTRDKLLETGVLEHQLKTDVTIVHGWATTLDESWSSLTDEQKHDAVRIIRRRAEALVDTTKRGLAQAAHAWPSEVDRPSVARDLAASLREIAEDMSAAALEHVVHYEGPRTLSCSIDVEAIGRAVQQLVENASKYSVAGSEIAVTLRMDDQAVVIEVVDEGVGIPADDDLFAPFVRHGSGEGSGLGLFMVRSAVESAGGNVSARRNDRWGSTFRIEVPTT